MDPDGERDALAKGLSVSFPVLSDANLTITRAYGAVETGKQHPAPMTLVLDANRKVLYAKKGMNPGDRPTIAQILETL